MLTGTTGVTTLQVTGNLYVSNALTTTNVYAAGFTSNLSNTVFNYSTLTVPFINATTLNVASTSNLGPTYIASAAGVTSLNVTGNVFASNALVAPSIYGTLTGTHYGILTGSNTIAGSTQTLSGTAGVTSLNVTGNIYVSNALTTTNVYAVRYYGDGGFLSNVNASGIVVAVKKVTSSYSVQLGDYYIGVNGTGVVITLPLGSSVTTGKTYVIKDESGLVTPNSVYRFTIQGSGSDLIDASTSITVTVSFISLTFLWNGTSWSII